MLCRFAAIILLACACTPVLREGIRPPDDHVARLRTEGILLDKVDGQDASRESRSTFVPPGTHSLAVSLDDRYPLTPRQRERRLSSGPLTLCFVASAGHDYVVKPTYRRWQWQPDIVDESIGKPIPLQSNATARTDCLVPTEELSPDSTAEGATSLAAAPNPPSRSADYVTDRDYVDPHLAGTGIALEAGMLLGGDNLGSGMSVSLGAQWTPLWIGDATGIGAIGIGLGGSFGYKGNSFRKSDSSVARSRYPWVVAVHTLVSLTDAWLLLLRGGIQSDSGISATVPDTAGQLHSLLGFVGEGGFYRPFSRHLAGSVVFRYSNLRYSSNGIGYPADSFGPLCTLHILL